MEENELYLHVDEEEERVVNIGRLFINIVKKWRAMLIYGLLLAVCFVGLKYLKDWKNYSQLEEEITTDSLEETLTTDEYGNVTSYVSLFEQLESIKQQRTNRLQYQLDPYNKKVLILNYAISLLDTNNDKVDVGTEIANHLSDSVVINQLATIYCNHILSDALIKEISKLTNNMEEGDLTALINSSYSNGVVCIQIAYIDGMDIQAIADIINNDMAQFSGDLQKISEHELTLTDETYNVIVDNDLAKIQTEMYTQIYNLQSQINNLENNFDDAEKEYVRVFLEDRAKGEIEEVDTEEVTDLQTKPTISKKWALIGFVLGIMLVCFWELMKYIFSDKLHSSDDLTDYLHLQIFGHQLTGEKKESPKGIDGLIYKLENRNKKVLSPEDQKEIIISGIRLYCEQNNLKEIVLTGTDIEGIDDAYIDEIKCSLNNAGINVSVEKNIYYYPESLQNCVKTPNIVLFETIESSIVNEIENVLVKAKEYNINVLGAVVMEV